ncbi:efflux RND transporter periplasmic adaptor subunit [Schaalia vaccimaxillae]|uniref:efflux RND transporter periplasmic adaptor subunit n=1 Tax=Schaalia vaccimaxillae TaxID=183916 RepID=UPI0003B61795|nr:efflux RND transporter periplasmic adaptor subunit [Schaalia vaccimaxillae]
MPTKVRSAQVFNVLKVLIWVVIAIALVKFAFFPGVAAKDVAQSLDPSADYGQITVAPTRGDITNSLSLQGTIEADEAAPVKATLDGEVSYLYVSDGAAVNVGDPIIEIRKKMPGEDTQVQDEEGNVTTVPGESWYKYATVRASAAGTLRMNALLGQQFAIGDTVATVAPSSYSAVANLTSDQMYRIQDVPASATISIKNGPAPFECTGVTIVTPKQAAAPNPKESTDSSSSSSSSSTSIRAKCSIPADQKVFPGLQVKMDLVAGQATGVLLVPASAVEGRYQSGFVYVPGDDPQNPVKTPVELGLTDGKNVEVKSGIDESTQILEYTPNAQAEKDKEASNGPSEGSGEMTGSADEGATGAGSAQ